MGETVKKHSKETHALKQEKEYARQGTKKKIAVNKNKKRRKLRVQKSRRVNKK